MSNFIISCGGTGGHLSPGIAVAERLKERGHNCTLIISGKQVDARLVQSYADKFDFVTSPGCPLSFHPVGFAKFCWHQSRALLFAARIVRKKKPDAVIAFGGFITLGISLAAYVNERPIVYHEANRVTGRAIRYLRALADRIYLPMGKRMAGVAPGVIRNEGFPIRQGIRHLPKEIARKTLGMPVEGKLLVVQGGSQGASALNKWVEENHPQLAAEGINIICLTGLGKGEDSVVKSKDARGRETLLRYMSFSDDMGTLLSAADLVVARAGAGSIAEMIHCEVPSILIPYPHAAENHQMENARFIERQGGCIIVEEKRLSTLFSEVCDTIFDDWLLQQFTSNLERMENKRCASDIANDLEDIAKRSLTRTPSTVDLPA